MKHPKFKIKEVGGLTLRASLHQRDTPLQLKNRFRRQKAVELSRSCTDAAIAVAAPFNVPIPFRGLLKRKPFPDRRTPHRIIRQRKQIARKMFAVATALSALASASGAARMAVIASTPIPNYEKGGADEDYCGPEILTAVSTGNGPGGVKFV